MYLKNESRTSQLSKRRMIQSTQETSDNATEMDTATVRLPIPVQHARTLPCIRVGAGHTRGDVPQLVHKSHNLIIQPQHVSAGQSVGSAQISDLPVCAGPAGQNVADV